MPSRWPWARPNLLGHPLSQLYVAKYMTPESRREVEAMVARMEKHIAAPGSSATAGCRRRRGRRLSQTFDKTEIRVGYPSKWIDYGGVVVRARRLCR